MKEENKKGNVFIYIILLVNITLIIGYVVLNNVYILNNNINIGKNVEEVFSSVYDKGNINIETVKKYNSNGNGFIDLISCPTNITMSGTTLKSTGIVSQMVYDLGSIYCSGYYNSNEFRIYFDKDFNDFVKSYYKGDIVDIVKSSGTNINVGSTNIAPSSTITGTTPYNGHLATHSADFNNSTYFESYYRSKNEYLKYQFASDKSIGWITIKKDSHSYGRYWHKGNIYLYDSAGNELDNIGINNMKTTTLKDIDLKYRGLTNDVRSVKIKVKNKWLDIKEFEIYELESTGSEEVWEISRTFNDSDNTLLTFTPDGIGGGDNIDDDFNSDNYKVTSTDNTYYSNNYQDDDIVPRLTVFGSVKHSDKYYNIFWNNYKTNDFIGKNTNNDDNINLKIGDISSAYLFIDLFNEEGNINYNMKILEFDRNEYKNKYTLLPLNSSKGLDLTESIGYIQNNSGALSLSNIKTGNEYNFDFKDKDYALFLTNKVDGNLAYRITGESTTGTGIYINPIDDSGTGIIESLSNHIIIGREKNFIGEDFVIVGSK